MSIQHTVSMTGTKEGLTIGDLREFVTAVTAAGSGDHVVVTLTTEKDVPTLAVDLQGDE